MENELYDSYTIQNGDNLYGIGKKYNVNPELLALINGLNISDYIYSGQEILVPKSGYSFYLTKTGDELNEVLELFNTSYEDFLSINKKILLDENQLFAYKR